MRWRRGFSARRTSLRQSDWQPGRIRQFERYELRWMIAQFNRKRKQRPEPDWSAPRKPIPSEVLAPLVRSLKPNHLKGAENECTQKQTRIDQPGSHNTGT